MALQTTLPARAGTPTLLWLASQPVRVLRRTSLYGALRGAQLQSIRQSLQRRFTAPLPKQRAGVGR